MMALANSADALLPAVGVETGGTGGGEGGSEGMLGGIRTGL